MAKPSRRARIAQQKARSGNGNGNGLTLQQISTVERNPFIPPTIEPRGDARVRATAHPEKQYVPSLTTGYYPFLRALPPYQDELTRQFGLDLYDRMWMDPIVHSSGRLFTLGLLANGYEIRPSIEKDKQGYEDAVDAAKIIKDNLNSLETPYLAVLEMQLYDFLFGVSVLEQDYQVWHGMLRMKDMREKPLGNTIFVVDSFYKTVGILTQRFPGQNFPAGSYIPIDFAQIGMRPDGTYAAADNKEEFDLSALIPGFLPRSKFSVLTNEPRYNDERGRSGLRVAYQAWWLKQQMIAEWLKYLSRFGSPSIIGKTAPGAVSQNPLNADLSQQLDGEGNPLPAQTPEQILSAQLAAFQNGGVIAIPAGAEIDIAEATGSGEAFAQALTWCDSQIVRGLTAQFLATSEGVHQARASSDTHQDILSLGILWRKQRLAEQQRREVFKRLLMYNYDIKGEWVDRFVPYLDLGLGDGFPIKAEDIAHLQTSGYLDPSQYERLDVRLGLPRRENVQQMAGPAQGQPQPNQGRGGDFGELKPAKEGEEE